MKSSTPESSSAAEAKQNSPIVEYDRSSTGWEIPWVTTETTLDDGSVVRSSHAAPRVVRPPHERERCGPYKDPVSGQKRWGDHRVTIQGSTCEETDCYVAHAVNTFPGWSEDVCEDENMYDRPGLQPIAASLEGWDAGGHLTSRIGPTTAWVAADVVLDALRDAGYEVVKKADK